LVTEKLRKLAGMSEVKREEPKRESKKVTAEDVSAFLTGD